MPNKKNLAYTYNIMIEIRQNRGNLHINRIFLHI